MGCLAINMPRLQKWLKRPGHSKHKSDRRVFQLTELLPHCALDGVQVTIDCPIVEFEPEGDVAPWIEAMDRIAWASRYCEDCIREGLKPHATLLYNMWTEQRYVSQPFLRNQTLHLDEYVATEHDYDQIVKLEDLKYNPWSALSLTKAGIEEATMPLYAKIITRLLRTKPNLTVLDLSYNPIGVAGLRAGLLDIISTEPLKGLKLRNCAFQDDQEPARIIRDASTLIYLDLSDNSLASKFAWAIFQRTRPGVRIKRLYLTNNNFTAEDLSRIVDTLTDNHFEMFQTLEVSHNPGSSDYAAILEQQPPKMRRGRNVKSTNQASRTALAVESVRANPFPCFDIHYDKLDTQMTVDVLKNPPESMTWVDISHTTGNFTFPIPTEPSRCAIMGINLNSAEFMVWEHFRGEKEFIVAPQRGAIHLVGVGVAQYVSYTRPLWVSLVVILWQRCGNFGEPLWEDSGQRHSGRVYLPPVRKRLRSRTPC